MHLFAKIGFAANEAVTSLKLVEKGFKREDLAIAVLIDFPFQIVGGWLAANWSRGDRPLHPWIIAFWPRLLLTLVATLIVYWFPTPPITFGFFTFLVVHTVVSSFASYVSFFYSGTSDLLLSKDCPIRRDISFPHAYLGPLDWRDLHDGELIVSCNVIRMKRVSVIKHIHEHGRHVAEVVRA
jgi:hypothetical protein